MLGHGLLVNYQWCSGCQSCEIACRNEHGWDLSQYGIKVLDLGPFEINKDIKASGIDWYYIAAPTSLCDLCADRVSTGGIPTCQLHCLAGVIEYGPVDVLADKLKSSEPHKMNLFIP